MIQASLKRKFELGTGKGCLNPALVLSPESIKTMSNECSECTLREKNMKKLSSCSSSKSKVLVHRLTATYLK